ncbi:MAG: FAD-dependent oxidoreductase [Caldilineaceae bacterium]
MTRVVHLTGGIGAIAETLAQAVRDHGGAIHYRQEVTAIVLHKARAAVIHTKRGAEFVADVVIANLPPWNIARLLDEDGNRPGNFARCPSPKVAGAHLWFTPVSTSRHSQQIPPSSPGDYANRWPGRSYG